MPFVGYIDKAIVALSAEPNWHRPHVARWDGLLDKRRKLVASLSTPAARQAAMRL
jgi:hypothetical protein